MSAFGVVEPTTGPPRRGGADANMAKLLASKATWRAAEATFAAYGGFAFAREYDI